MASYTGLRPWTLRWYENAAKSIFSVWICVARLPGRSFYVISQPVGKGKERIRVCQAAHGMLERDKSKLKPIAMDLSIPSPKRF